MAYTPEQIDHVCDACFEIMGQFTDVQNCSFPTDPIRRGMAEGLSAEEIGEAAYQSIIALPLRQTGFGLVGMGDSMHNIAIYMKHEVMKRINEINGDSSSTGGEDND